MLANITQREPDTKVVDVLDPKAITITAVGEKIKWTDFIPALHCNVGQGDSYREYFRRANEDKTSIKWGQAKLCLVEIQFLVRHWDPAKVPNPHIVYVGAAIGSHISPLSKMFPMAEFHLYDPRDFSTTLSENKNIHIYQKFFEEEDVKKWSGRNDVFFICDIRTVEYNRSEDITEETAKEIAHKNEKIVRDDMARQADWVRAIRPVKAHLKFRLPYSWGFIKEETLFEEYLDGDLYIQPWAPQTSTEARLVPRDDLIIRKWDYKRHEEQMFYHNTVTRESNVRFNNSFHGGAHDAYDQANGLTNDYDSAYTIYIFKSYLRKIRADPTEERTLRLAKYVLDNCNIGVTLVGIRTGDARMKIAYEKEPDE
jgi:hypothetical protein